MELTRFSDQITDVTASVPKVINPSTHAVIDYVAAGTFFAAGMALRNRHSRASRCAFLNGMAALGLAMLTDYPGGIFRTVSFRTHGVIDVLMTGMCALGPTMMGFAQDAEAQIFHTQAALEAAVVAATDWNSPAVARG